MNAPKRVILILGPTAGGKSNLAISLAKRLGALADAPGTPGGECICADSMQIYRGMDIGTAKPTPQQRAEVPHHLLDLVDPSEDGFSVDAWLQRAERTIEEIQSRQRHPIVVGGTNLYIQALLQGLFDGPQPDAAIRAQLQGAGPASLRKRLEAVDPAAAQRIHPNDRKRTIRALEVYEMTGRRISDMQRQWLDGPPRRDVRIIGLDYSAEAINARINARVKAMIEGGMVDEVRRLIARGGFGRQASEALGYKQIIAHLAGAWTLEEAIEQIKIRTRRFAKQQRTWLRRFQAHPEAVWLAGGDLSHQELVAQSIAATTDRAEAAGLFDPNAPASAGDSTAGS